MGKRNKHNQLLRKDSRAHSVEEDDDDEDTIAGMLNSGGSGNKPILQLNVSAGENMISFDAYDDEKAGEGGEGE